LIFGSTGSSLFAPLAASGRKSRGFIRRR